MIRRAEDVIITKRCLFLPAFPPPPKKRESFLPVVLTFSAPVSPLTLPVFEFGLCGCDVDVTKRLPSLRMRSLLRVRTGDHSMSSWEGGGSSVMRWGRERIWLLRAEGVVGGATTYKLVLLSQHSVLYQLWFTHHLIGLVLGLAVSSSSDEELSVSRDLCPIVHLQRTDDS